MSLYHYFDTRDELLELMADTVAAEMVVPGELPTDWRAALRGDRATTAAQRSSRHPWLLHDAPGPPAGDARTCCATSSSPPQSVAPLAEAGVDPALLSGIVTAVDDYTIGYTLRELALGGPRRARPPASPTRFARSPHVR